MKKIILIFLMILGLGFVLNVGSGYSIDTIQNKECRINESCRFTGVGLQKYTEERGFPFSFSVDTAADAVPEALNPFDGQLEAGSFLSNQVFWMGISGVVLAVLHWLKKLVSRTVLAAVVLAAVLAYVGVLKIA